MLRVSSIQAAGIIASRNFSFEDLKFEGFEDISETSFRHELSVQKEDTLESYEDEFKQLDIWAHMSVAFKGEPPESYRVLNSIVLDYVDDKESEIKKEINPKLKKFLSDQFLEIDVEDLDEIEDDYIWEDQVDYFPGVDPEDNRLHFFIELVLELDDDEENLE